MVNFRAFYFKNGAVLGGPFLTHFRALEPRGTLPYKPLPSFFSLNSWTGYKNWWNIPKQVVTISSRTIGYCFPVVFWKFLWSNNSETATIRHWLSFWNNLGLSYHKCMKRNPEFRKKNIFQETPFNKRSAKYSTQNDGMVERCHKCIRVRGLSFE